MTIVAKPVIDNEFWILQENNRKVGNIEACAGGYQVRLNNQVSEYKTIRMAAERVNIRFEPTVKSSTVNALPNQVHGYPVQGRVHNPMWLVSDQLPVYTRTAKSKSWYAAGWYRVLRGRTWHTVLSPKLIVVQRYTYAGPFVTKQQADDHAHTEVC
jgi:hypothetical protein